MTNTVKEKPLMTIQELSDSLMVISETAKTLAEEVLLIPSDKEKPGKEDKPNG